MTIVVSREKFNPSMAVDYEKWELWYLLLDCYIQACSTPRGYHHGFIGVWEDTEQMLLDVGLLEEVTK